MKHLASIVFFYCIFLSHLCAQIIVSGKVFDGDAHIVMPGVSVLLANSNIGLQTDVHGRYYLHAKAGDTIRFSFLGYQSKKMVIPAGSEFYSEDIFLFQKNISLPGVTVKAIKNYHADSIENRTMNAEIFQYEQKSLGSTLMGSLLSPLGITQTYRRARKLNSMSKFQDQLISQEHDRFIDRRFSKNLVYLITGLKGHELQEFMKEFRPDYEFTLRANEYDFMEQIKHNYQLFRIN